MADTGEPMASRVANVWQSLDSCAVSDALDRLGHNGVVLGIRHPGGNARIVGRAVTVELGPVAKGTSSSRHLGVAAIEEAAAGDVIVIAHRGRTDCAGWGGNLSRAALRTGIAGAVVDGACRDLGEAAAIGFPVFCRDATPRTARGRVCELSYQHPVIIDGVAVHPGDLVIADECGVVFVRKDYETSVAKAAAEIMAKETAMSGAIDAGVPLREVMGADYERMTMA
jgi:4-hydroxy-4-methyl-2-oxoglutarate aldolase